MIDSLKPNQIFIFGSNANGIHGGGAAHTALKFGALYGLSKGATGGQTYGIVTLDRDMQQVPLSYIGGQLEDLAFIARANPNYTFLLTPIGTGIAGFDLKDIEGLVNMANLPENVTRTWVQDE